MNLKLVALLNGVRISETQIARLRAVSAFFEAQYSGPWFEADNGIYIKAPDQNEQIHALLLKYSASEGAAPEAVMTPEESHELLKARDYFLFTMPFICRLLFRVADDGVRQSLLAESRPEEILSIYDSGLASALTADSVSIQEEFVRLMRFLTEKVPVSEMTTTDRADRLMALCSKPGLAQSVKTDAAFAIAGLALLAQPDNPFLKMFQALADESKADLNKDQASVLIGAFGQMKVPGTVEISERIIGKFLNDEDIGTLGPFRKPVMAESLSDFIIDADFLGLPLNTFVKFMLNLCSADHEFRAWCCQRRELRDRLVAIASEPDHSLRPSAIAIIGYFMTDSALDRSLYLTPDIFDAITSVPHDWRYYYQELAAAIIVTAAGDPAVIAGFSTVRARDFLLHYEPPQIYRARLVVKAIGLMIMAHEPAKPLFSEQSVLSKLISLIHSARIFLDEDIPEVVEIIKALADNNPEGLSFLRRSFESAEILEWLKEMRLEGVDGAAWNRQISELLNRITSWRTWLVAIRSALNL